MPNNASSPLDPARLRDAGSDTAAASAPEPSNSSTPKGTTSSAACGSAHVAAAADDSSACSSAEWPLGASHSPRCDDGAFERVKACFHSFGVSLRRVGPSCRRFCRTHYSYCYNDQCDCMWSYR
jgi:hypothetical protein